ncbi:MAG TPA: hypothetical protein VK116_14810, partial [Planctomycetota bacterium]|nr:hypothetical protein [Planctomycetota bacterium]
MSSFRRESVVSRLRVALVALSAFLIVGESVFASSSLAERLGERWRWRVFDREEGLHRGMITAMDQNSDDYIYAASERGLSRYDLHHWEIVESSEALDDGPIVSIVEGANAIYCASRHSVWLARGGTRLDRLHPVSEPTSGSVFLAASRLGEVFVIDGASHYRVRERVERVDDGVLVPGGVLDYEIDADGVHWIATEAGLRYRDLAGQQARWLEVRAPDLPFPDASCVRLLRVDSPPRVPLPRPQRVSSRELWGVFRIDRERAGGFRLARLEGRDWIPLDAPALDSPPDGIVRDPRGSYVITCESGRLYVLDVDADADSTPRWIGVQELGIGPVKLHGGILDSRGTLWFRLGAGGVASVDTRSERWERLAVPRVASPPYPRVTSLLEERDGSVWAGTTDFLLRYPSTRDGELADEPEVFHTILETPLRDVTALGEQTRESFLPSRIWIGSESFQGLFFYEPRGDETP